MSEIDLVPPRYHRRRMLLGWLLRAGAVYLVVAIAMVGVRGFLDQGISKYDREIADFRIERKRADEEQQQIEQLRKKKESLVQRLEVLEGLRGGVAAKQMFSVVDDSLDESVGFRRWSFRRAGEIVNEGEKAVETGYFIVLPRESSDEPQRTWQFQTHMEILADARDHSALASFVRRLSQQPEIQNARILNTHSRKVLDSERVEFELAVVVRSTR